MRAEAETVAARVLARKLQMLHAEESPLPRKGRGVAGASGIPAAIPEQVLAALSALLVYA
jgi:hypothetical protein